MLTGAALFSGFYVNELLLKLLARQDPHDALFDAYAATLPELGAAQEQPVQAALRAFELTALREIGLLPDLSVVTLTQQPVRPGGRYSLSADAGVGGSSGREAELGGDHLIGLQAALQHGSMAALQHACRACLAELKAPLRALVQHHVGSTVLRTRQALLDMHSL